MTVAQNTQSNMRCTNQKLRSYRGKRMSRFSDAYWRAVRRAKARIEQQDRVREALKRKHAYEAHVRARGKQTFKESDKIMRELRRPSDTPPWEKD
jgi:hypothetical protein